MSKTGKHIAFICLCVACGLGSQSNAQTEVQVITKTVEKSFQPKPGNNIKIEGEAAKIKVEGWNKREVKVTIKLVSKGLSRSIAEKELEYQKYAINDVKNTHVIRNYLLVPQDLKELSTIQESHVTVYLPAQSFVKVKNGFGEIWLKNLRGNTEVESEYGEIHLDNVMGKVEITSNFGDLFVENISGESVFDLTHTKTQMSGVNGMVKISSSLGDVTISKMDILGSLKFSGEKSDITIFTTAVEKYHWEIETKYGKLLGSEKLTSGVSSLKNIKLEYGSLTGPAISIKTDFGIIQVLEK